ncbi:hypothetical protein HID58_012421 [Brassica napus]|uniref:Pentatricopeptide repeat-containing protein n=1 Tax=Brassica napus TaxID=3708 RepID=A0ABQ8E110_BRANA|nr:pentatricopeptide repeat-containing protein At4g21190-like [Brassica napus]XP_048622717.1 pentatricopeptide repeat-containing protein At4g21190-like [Brassica napus]KAH0935304.1 hypothetical protein HID58_012421 [Brassica napus]
MEHLEGTPRKFFNKMISIYYKRDMHHKLFEVFADMEELGVKPNLSIVNMVGKVFLKLGMKDKYEKQLNELSEGEGGFSSDEDDIDDKMESKSEVLLSDEEPNKVDEPIKSI